MKLLKSFVDVCKRHVVENVVMMVHKNLKTTVYQNVVLWFLLLEQAFEKWHFSKFFERKIEECNTKMMPGKEKQKDEKGCPPYRTPA